MTRLELDDFGLVHRFVEIVLDRYKDGEQDRVQAGAVIVHLIAAVLREGGDDPRAYMKAVIADKDA